MTEIRKFEVGGCVRDSIMGRRSKDVDYVVTGFESFEAMAAWVATQGEVFVTTPETFTVRARVGRDVFDYVWARKDGPYSDGRHPDFVEPGTLLDDLARRDFTINAIARDPETGEVIDPHNGITDINSRLIRTVGDPQQRFTEDALRIARGVRFAVRFGFVIGPNTATAMMAMGHRLREPKLQNRLREELTQAFRENTLHTLRLLRTLDLDRHVFAGDMWLLPTHKG
jgi:tRNA nucleotidyltransferase (CCA-adding enzyme)